MRTDITGHTWQQICNIIKEFRERDFTLSNSGGRITLMIGNPIKTPLLLDEAYLYHDKEG